VANRGDDIVTCVMDVPFFCLRYMKRTHRGTPFYHILGGSIRFYVVSRGFGRACLCNACYRCVVGQVNCFIVSRSVV
jgi:hypothetical protein